MSNESVIYGVCEYLGDHGYRGEILTSTLVRVILNDHKGRSQRYAYIHLDNGFVVLESPEEIRSSQLPPKENFKTCVDLSDPQSLPQLVDHLSQIRF